MYNAHKPPIRESASHRFLGALVDRPRRVHPLSAFVNRNSDSAFSKVQVSPRLVAAHEELYGQLTTCQDARILPGSSPHKTGVGGGGVDKF